MKKRASWLLVIGLLFVVIILLGFVRVKINGLVSYDNLEGERSRGITGRVSFIDRVIDFFTGEEKEEVFLQAPTITAVINASRETCTSPCAIFFEGTESTDALGNKIGDANGGQGLLGNNITEYTWDFGEGSESDTSSGGRYFSGFNAAHVYETNGTKTVTLTIRDKNNNVHSATQQIVVNAFSGTVICRANDDLDWSDCPAGATRQVTSSYTGAPANTKVLYRRGDVFTYTTVSISQSAIVGAFGSCINPDQKGICANNPLMEYSGSGGGSAIPFSNAISVMDIHIDGNDIAGNNLVDGDVGLLGGNDILVLRVLYDHYQRSPVYADKFFIVNSILTNADKQNMFYSGSRLALVNNNIGPVAIEHNLYGDHIDRGVITGNYWHGAPLVGVRLSGQTAKTWNVIVSDNEIENTVLAVAIHSQAAPQPNAGGQNILIEKNYMHNNTQGVAGDRDGYSDIIIRNNLFRNNGIDFSVYEHNDNLIDTERLRFYANTIQATGPGSVGVTQSGAKDIEIFNNIIVGGGDESSAMNIDPNAGVTKGNNLFDPIDPQFDTSSPTGSELLSTSPAIDKGANLSLVFDDFEGTRRPQGASWDIGAYEYQGQTQQCITQQQLNLEIQKFYNGQITIVEVSNKIMEHLNNPC